MPRAETQPVARRVGLSPGVLAGLVVVALGIAAGKQGTVWVADTRNDQVRKPSPDGKALGLYGSRGAGAAMLQEPVYLALDEQGELCVAEKTGRRVQKLVPGTS